MMKDPYFYIAFMFISNGIALLVYSIFSAKTVVGWLVRTAITLVFMTWQAYIYLNR